MLACLLCSCPPAYVLVSGRFGCHRRSFVTRFTGVGYVYGGRSCHGPRAPRDQRPSRHQRPRRAHAFRKYPVSSRSPPKPSLCPNWCSGYRRLNDRIYCCACRSCVIASAWCASSAAVSVYGTNTTLLCVFRNDIVWLRVTFSLHLLAVCFRMLISLPLYVQACTCRIVRCA